jgi:hypothetical protein
MDFAALIQLGMAAAGEEKAKNMSQAQLRLLGEQVARINGIPLPDMPEIQADQLGASAEGSLAPDENLRSKQLAALGEIQNVIDSGGLDLTDKANLEESMNGAINQQRRARAGVASDAAARGQMNSGNRLMMDMNAAQTDHNDARKSGIEVAGMAQRRRLQAIQDSANMAAAMRNEDWSQKDAAARARDMRDERNAAAREKAQYYNAGLPQQRFTNEMARATGSQPASNAYAGALAAGATDARMSAAGMGNVANQAVNGITSSKGKDPYVYDSNNYDSNDYASAGGNQDIRDPDDK